MKLESARRNIYGRICHLLQEKNVHLEKKGFPYWNITLANGRGIYILVHSDGSGVYVGNYGVWEGFSTMSPNDPRIIELVERLTV